MDKQKNSGTVKPLKKSSGKGLIAVLTIAILALVGGACILLFVLPKDNDNKTENNTNAVVVKQELNIELGSEMPNIQEFLESGSLSENAEIIFEDKENLNKIGTYEVSIKDGENIYKSILNVKDTTAPELTVKNIEFTEGEKKSVSISDFVESCTDNSGEECQFSFVDENREKTGTTPEVGKGERVVRIMAFDNSGNEVIKEAELVVKEKVNTNTNTNTNTSSNTTKKNTNSNTKNNSNNNNNTNTTPAPAPKATPMCAKSNLKLLNKQLGNPYMLHDVGENVTEKNDADWDRLARAWEMKMPWGSTGRDFASKGMDVINHMIAASQGKKYGSYTWGNVEVATVYCGSLGSGYIRGSYWTGIVYAHEDDAYLQSKGIKSNNHYQALAYVYLKENYKADIKILVDWLKPYATCTSNCDLMSM